MLSNVNVMSASMGLVLDSWLITSVISAMPVSVSWERKVIPIIKVMTAWKSNTILPHLMGIEEQYCL
jgi:hypothetical protein